MKTPIICIFLLLFINNIFASDIKVSNSKNMDKFINLVWEDKRNAKLEEKSWQFAKNYCKDLETDNKKWRLPTLNELKSYNKTPHTNNIVQDDYYWSSTQNVKDENEALIFDISNKNPCEGLIAEDNYYVLCVRSHE